MANNPQNLKSNSERTPEERKALARKAGQKSGEARRKKKTMREMLDYLLEKEVTNSKTGEKATTLEAVMTACIKKAIAGDIKAAEFIRDTIGQKPKDTVEAVNTNIDISDKKVIDTVINKLKDL